jgi:O-antigen/teichoic acid export membrane protein
MMEGDGTELAAASEERSPTADATREQLRGSSLLLAGRAISLGVNFVIQVLIVRYLAQADYGAFAYVLALVSLIQTFVTFGLDRSITRFLPIYEERGDYGRLFGTLFMVLGTFCALGLGAVLVVVGLQDWLSGVLAIDEATTALLAILVLLAPIHALDDLMVGLFAVFANARAIFVRRYVLGPLSRLLVVGLLVATGQSVEFLAAGYVLSGAVILLAYGGLLVSFMRRRGILDRLSRSEIHFPVREVLTFTIPLMSSDLLYALMSATDVLLLSYFHGPTEVADLRVILPAATLNQVIFSSFALLFTPAAARLFAREDAAGINALYWRTAAWMAVLTFPVFLLTFSIAEPFTVLLFEERYAGSAPYLAILSLGMYFNVALGFNGLTLKVMGRIRYIVVLNLAAAVANVALNILLIPLFGALGAAIATGVTLVLHNLFKQAGLRLAGVRVLDARYLRVYASIAVVAALVLIAGLVGPPPLPAALTLAALGSAAVVWLNREVIDIGDTFPELLRVPLLGRVVGKRR